MSRESLSNLLDAMLEESEIRLAAAEEREREERARRELQRANEPNEKSAEEIAELQSVAMLARLREADLRKVLAKAAPDDLLVVLATADESLQRRILGSLTADSVKWLRANLEHIDVVTNAEREAAERKVLKVANALLRAGEIGAPEPEPAGEGDDAGAGDEAFRELLIDLVRLAGQTGPEALNEVVASAGEPLLEYGLPLAMEGRAGSAVRAALAAKRAELERAYARRLAWMEEALVAIADGETAESLRARLGP